jgi:formylglycine-generating enzyme
MTKNRHWYAIGVTSSVVLMGACSGSDAAPGVDVKSVDGGASGGASSKGGSQSVAGANSGGMPGGGTPNSGGNAGTGGDGGDAGSGGNTSTGGIPSTGSGGATPMDAGADGAATSGGASGAGGVSSDAGAGSGGVTGTSDGGDGTAVGTLGEPCSPNGAYGCAGHAQRGQLLCSGGAWTARSADCASGTYCDTRPSNAGFCEPVVAECAGVQPGAFVCRGPQRLECGIDLVTAPTVEACTGGCLNGACTECQPAAKECVNLTPRTCSPSGAWVNGAACTNQACVNGACTGVCAPGAKRCSGNGVQTCSPTGQWGTAVDCPAANPVCSAGACALPRSCQGLAATCGPNGNATCCSSPVVPGGTFNRSNDASYPATVSGFRLDAYEVTVGRFRKFVEGYTGPPATGSGKNSSDPTDAGWDSIFNGQLPADGPALVTAMNTACVAPSSTFTWTVTAGVNETRPMNCVRWYEAFAFCIWDGGRLPTEAEWNYAAAGGNEQRQYPWSNPPSSTTIDATYASYECSADPSGGCTVTDLLDVGSLPAGNGRWGHADLAGNVREWTRDYFADPYPLPCNNCSNRTQGTTPNRVIRGGGYGQMIAELLTSHRFGAAAPTDYRTSTGLRCARTQ